MSWLILFLASSLAFAAKTEVHGHRGARGSRPENTLPAFTFALEKGVDILELDLAVSADDVLVVSHEPHITPEHCLDSEGKKLSAPLVIRTLKYDEIKKYDCGSLANDRFPKQVAAPKTSMPRLEDVFELVKNSKAPTAKTVRFNIETKIYPYHPEYTPTPQEFAAKIIASARKAGILDRMILQSFDDRTLLAAKKIEPKLVTSLLMSDNHVDYVAAARAARANILSPDHTWLLAEDVQKLHKAGIKVHPWTANETKDWDRLIAFGVDGIITDYPKELIEHLRK